MKFSIIPTLLLLANNTNVTTGFHLSSRRVLVQQPLTTQLSSFPSSSSPEHDDALKETSSILSRRKVFDNTYKSVAFTTSSSLAGLYNTPLIANAIDEETTTAPISTVSSTSSPTVPTINLGKSQLKISRTIQGYWQLAGGHGKYNPDEAIKNMEAHYKAGVTTLDTADIYGPSEQIMGKFLEKTTGATACTKFCCFRYLDEIDKNEVRSRIKKVCMYT